MGEDLSVAALINKLNLGLLDERDLWTLLTEANWHLWHHDDIGQIWEGLRDSVRAVINERVRPKLRPLTISDLPDELLRDVFEYVRGHTGMYELSYYPCGNFGDIKNIRLTYRRFYETSSHLLLYFVKTSLTPESLARLDEVSRHPYISKGLRGVNLFLGPFYPSALAGNIRTFVEYRAFQLRDSIESWERMIAWQITDQVTPLEVYQRAITKAIPLVESWEEAAGQGIDITRADHLMLSRAYSQYCQRYEHHKTFYESFSQAVAYAIMRMPGVTWVQVEDEDIYEMGRGGRIFPKDLDEPGSLLEKLLSPLDWRDARVHELGPPPFNIIGGLLLSLQQLGIHLKGLDILTAPPTSGLSNAPTTPDEQELCAAVRQLKAICFCPRKNISEPSWAERPADEWILFIGFLSRLLQTKSLQSIDLSFSFMYEYDSPPLLSMAPILMSNTWPILKVLHFVGPFHLDELKTVIRRLEKNIELQWGGYILSGSWAEVLDVVKEYDSWEASIGDVNVSVYGQECDEMTPQERDVIFKAKDILSYRGSRATEYTRNAPWQRSNPVRDWETGELVMPEALIEDE